MNKTPERTLLCPTCGGEDFEYNVDTSFAKCKKCGREFHRGYDELLEYNSSSIEEVKKQIKHDAVEEVKDAFKGLGNIKSK